MNPLLPSVNPSLHEPDPMVKATTKSRPENDEPRQSFKDTFNKRPKVERTERSERVESPAESSAEPNRVKNHDQSNNEAVKAPDKLSKNHQNKSSEPVTSDAQAVTEEGQSGAERSTSVVAEPESSATLDSEEVQSFVGELTPFLSVNSEVTPTGLSGLGLDLENGLKASVLSAVKARLVEAEGVSLKGLKANEASPVGQTSMQQSLSVQGPLGTLTEGLLGNKSLGINASTLKSSHSGAISGSQLQDLGQKLNRESSNGLRSAFDILSNRVDLTGKQTAEQASVLVDKEAPALNMQTKGTAAFTNQIVTATKGGPDIVPSMMEKLDTALQGGTLNQHSHLVTNASQPSLSVPSGIPSVGDARVQMPISITFGQQGWANMVAERSALMAAQSIKFAELQLDPPELGPLQVKVTVNQDQATVSFVASNAQVKDALDQSVLRLKELLEEQGLDLVDVDVSDQSSPEESEGDADSESGLLAAEDENGQEPELSEQTISVEGQYGVDHYA